MLMVAIGTAHAADATEPLGSAQVAYAVPGPSNVAGTPTYPTPFIRTIRRSVETGLFPKWHGAITRTKLQLDGGGTLPPVMGAGRVAETRSVFDRIVATAMAKSGLDLLTTVNSLVDAVPYRSDQELYGVSDYWATPLEMLAAGGGDCEDHAIAKLAALNRAGVPEDELRLVVGIDIATGKAHAMAVAELDGTAYALDGRTGRVVRWSSAELQFKPLYAAGFHRVWIYRS